MDEETKQEEPQEKKKRGWPTQKALTRRVASDDMKMTVEGEDYYPHSGEYVVMLQKLSAAGMITVLEISSLQGQDMTDPEVAQRHAEVFRDACALLADVVMEWDWKGMDGKPYPQPRGKPRVIASLHLDEFTWLINQYQAPAAVSKN